MPGVIMAAMSATKGQAQDTGDHEGRRGNRKTPIQADVHDPQHCVRRCCRTKPPFALGRRSGSRCRAAGGRICTQRLIKVKPASDCRATVVTTSHGRQPRMAKCLAPMTRPRAVEKRSSMVPKSDVLPVVDEDAESRRVIPARRPAAFARVADPRFVLVRCTPARGWYPSAPAPTQRRGEPTT
jgi:hypothetical protein